MRKSVNGADMKDSSARRRRRFAGAVALALVFTPLGANAQFGDRNSKDCADPKISAERAEKACSVALDTQNPSRDAAARLLVNRGGARLDLGRDLAALSDFDAALSIDPAMFEAMTGRARALNGLGRWAEGIAQFDAAIARRPRDVNALMGRGAAHLSLGDWAAALADFDRSVQLSPRDLDARYNRGVAKLGIGDKNGAATDFSTVIQGDPNDAGAHLMRGRARVGVRDPLALTDFSRAIALSPEWGQAWFERGRQLDRMGRTEDANVDFRRAFELGYQDRWLQERILSIGR